MVVTTAGEGFYAAGRSGQANNHVHSRYSFSPYTPAEAVRAAKGACLDVVGLIDHDTLAGCREMLDVAEETGIAATTGCEIRVNAQGTRFEGRRINNPDSPGLLYMVIHGVPAQSRVALEKRLLPIRRRRLERSRQEVAALNELLVKRRGLNLELDFERDVLAVSEWKSEGTVTERHILYALARKMVLRFGLSYGFPGQVEEALEIEMGEAFKQRFQQEERHPYLHYDLLGVFKATLLDDFFVQPNFEECPSVLEFTALAQQLGAIPCYPYLGDVVESPTGDKKAQKFEDDWLEELFSELPGMGFQALSYMPPRNTRKQLDLVSSYCQDTGLMEISGVDINSPRQSFVTPVLDEPCFQHLARNTWALVAHENLSNFSGPGLFSENSSVADRDMEYRLDVYARMGLKMDAKNRASILEIAEKEIRWKKS